MNNEQAIKYINKNFKGKGKTDAVAILFACEDIIELDIEEWVATPTTELLDSFIIHMNSSCDDMIPKLLESDVFVSTEDKLWALADSMRRVMESMQKYVDIHETLRNNC